MIDQQAARVLAAGALVGAVFNVANDDLAIAPLIGAAIAAAFLVGLCLVVYRIVRR